MLEIESQWKGFKAVQHLQLVCFRKQDHWLKMLFSHTANTFLVLHTITTLSSQLQHHWMLPSKLSTRMTWGELHHLLLLKGLCDSWAPLLSPIVSVGSSVRQLNAQTVAGPLPKSIFHLSVSCQTSKTAGAHIWKQHVLKAFTTGRRGLRMSPERGCLLYKAAKQDTAKKKKLSRTNTGFILKWFNKMFSPKMCVIYKEVE